MLTLRDVKWAAPDGDAVLRGIDLEIPDHKLVVVTGPNGGGKTTLAKMIVGLEKPDSGSIELDGQDITNLDITQRARLGISFAFQQPVRFKGLTVMDLLELAAGGKIQKAEACEYLSRVGLCAREYIEVFQDLQKTLNGSMVIISHQERILAIADEIVVIAGGRVTAQGPAQEIMGKLLSGEKSCDSCPKQEVLYGGECHE